jgi:site-specific DNA-cytosine methylase
MIWAAVVRVLDLFSGIGGFSLGLERAGMRTVAFCEIDKYAQAVLRKHWPEPGWAYRRSLFIAPKSACSRAALR